MGIRVGDGVGLLVGIAVAGIRVGEKVGLHVGIAVVGIRVGDGVGLLVGIAVAGFEVGIIVGVRVGIIEGRSVGVAVGFVVGIDVGTALGGIFNLRMRLLYPSAMYTLPAGSAKRQLRKCSIRVRVSNTEYLMSPQRLRMGHTMTPTLLDLHRRCSYQSLCPRWW